MSEPDNPYQTPTSLITADNPVPASRTGARPLALWVLLIGYAWYCLLESVAVLAVMPRDSAEVAVVIASGVYSLVVGLCLWRGVNGMRWWVVVTTAPALLLLLFMVSRDIVDTNLMMAAICLLRIAIAALLFLPSIRRWFVSPRA